MAGVLRALDDAGVVVEHLQLDAPSLDDVFADATGRRLEGAAPSAEGVAG
jgi:ABC-2 type transport system ATP-binding protein